MTTQELENLVDLKLREIAALADEHHFSFGSFAQVGDRCMHVRAGEITTNIGGMIIGICETILDNRSRNEKEKIMQMVKAIAAQEKNPDAETKN